MAKVDLTGNEGASLERQAWMAKLKRVKKGLWLPTGSEFSILTDLENFGKGRTQRNAEKPGSLGRKKAVKK